MRSASPGNAIAIRIRGYAPLFWNVLLSSGGRKSLMIYPITLWDFVRSAANVSRLARWRQSGCFK
jgi:hypothetical protein